MFRKTPLAWRQLMKEKTRLLVAIAGIAFADMLILMQLGLQDALYDGVSQTQRLLKADLVLTNPQFQTLFSVQSFPRERLYQALSADGVASVSSIYIASGQWKNPDTRQNRAILIWGVDPEAPSFAVPEIEQNLPQLKQLNQVLFDRASRPEYGLIADSVQKQGTIDAEVNQQMIRVVGLFSIGATFAADGNVITLSLIHI